MKCSDHHKENMNIHETYERVYQFRKDEQQAKSYPTQLNNLVNYEKYIIMQIQTL